jgi:hypothetical protein
MSFSPGITTELMGAGLRLSSAGKFAVGCLALTLGSAILAGWMPLGFSIVTVFLFAGPHNWIEARYFLTRMPGRWGRLRTFFLFALAGIVFLPASFALLPLLARTGNWQVQSRNLAWGTWNTLLALWIALVIHLRSRQNPRRDWSWTVPLALVVVSLAWIAPAWWGLGLVYLHPLMALWILDRELQRSRPQWRRTYHKFLIALPLMLCMLCWRLKDMPSLPGQDILTQRITQHAGAGILSGISTHLLVAVHTFLEMLHYGVWLLAIPLVGLRNVAPWQVSQVPMARRSATWRRGLKLFLALGAAAVLLLWACFLADYPATRDVYFTLAMVHVLAEVPFLLRAL